MNIAVIGSGIAGLSAAYYLSRKHTVWVIERDSRIGGHTNTVAVDTPRGPLAVDTGFIVHNDRTYPKLIRLFGELGVATQPSDMSFAVSCPRTGFEYSSRGARGFFAQASNCVSPAHWRMFREILRFNREAMGLLNQPGADRLTIGDFLDQGRYNDEFVSRYLFPMASAVWSMGNEAMRGFPAATLVRFFDNHGMLGIDTHPKWKVLRGGSNSYLAPISAPFRERILTGAVIRCVERTKAGVEIAFADERPAMRFDQVVLACRAVDALPLIKDATEREREVLGAFRVSRNDVCLHTDESILPRRPQARASWNYRLGPEADSAATVTYHMNRLQSLDTPEQYCVTLNDTASIDPKKIIRRMTYEHPVYDLAAIQAQERWADISGADRIHFCGAYWRYGFHEDGLVSALRVARMLGAEI